MRRVLSGADFKVWLKTFFPALPDSFLKPVVPKGDYPYYQTGLMLHKARTMRGLADSIDSPKDAARLRAAANIQSATAEKVMFDYDYVGDHWLPAFFIYSR